MSEYNSQWRNATLVENRELSRGMRWLKIQLSDGHPVEHEPGNVVSLAMLDSQGHSLKHAYTVSRADAAAGTLEFLYRVIPQGRMTPSLAALLPGAGLRLYGRLGTPIAWEVDTSPAGIVLVSTGSGIGPLFGYAERALSSGQETPIRLFAGFREAEDACLESELGALARAFPHFKWQFSLSRPGPGWKGLRGRVTESMPPALGPIKDLHFHLVGNGNMVVPLYKALMLAGLEDERVTSEIYFNYPENLEDAAVQKLAARFSL